MVRSPEAPVPSEPKDAQPTALLQLEDIAGEL